MQNPIKIHRNQRAASLLNEIFIYRETSSKEMDVFYFEDGRIVVKRVEKGVYGIEPSFAVDELDCRELIRAFSELGKSMGIEVHSESKIAGKYEAQSHHLGDLRQLLKLK